MVKKIRFGLKTLIMAFLWTAITVGPASASLIKLERVASPFAEPGTSLAEGSGFYLVGNPEFPQSHGTGKVMLYPKGALGFPQEVELPNNLHYYSRFGYAIRVNPANTNRFLITAPGCNDGAPESCNGIGNKIISGWIGYYEWDGETTHKLWEHWASDYGFDASREFGSDAAYLSDGSIMVGVADLNPPHTSDPDMVLRFRQGNGNVVNYWDFPAGPNESYAGRLFIDNQDKVYVGIHAVDGVEEILPNGQTVYQDFLKAVAINGTHTAKNLQAGQFVNENLFFGVPDNNVFAVDNIGEDQGIRVVSFDFNLTAIVGNALPGTVVGINELTVVAYRDGKVEIVDPLINKVLSRVTDTGVNRPTQIMISDIDLDCLPEIVVAGYSGYDCQEHSDLENVSYFCDPYQPVITVLKPKCPTQPPSGFTLQQQGNNIVARWDADRTGSVTSWMLQVDNLPEVILDRDFTSYFFAASDPAIHTVTLRSSGHFFPDVNSPNCCISPFTRKSVGKPLPTFPINFTSQTMCFFNIFDWDLNPAMDQVQNYEIWLGRELDDYTIRAAVVDGPVSELDFSQYGGGDWYAAIRAVNAAGGGTFSNGQLLNAPSSGPRDLVARFQGDQIRVEWSPNMASEGVTLYHLFLGKNPNDYNGISTVTSDITDVLVELDPVSPGRQILRIEAQNGNDPAAPPRCFHNDLSLVSQPFEVAGVKAKVVKEDNSVDVSWLQRPAEEEILTYEILLGRDGEMPRRYRSVPSNRISAVLRDLPDGVYELQVRAANESGPGVESSSRFFTIDFN